MCFIEEFSVDDETLFSVEALVSETFFPSVVFWSVATSLSSYLFSVSVASSPEALSDFAVSSDCFRESPVL